MAPLVAKTMLASIAFELRTGCDEDNLYGLGIILLSASAHLRYPGTEVSGVHLIMSVQDVSPELGKLEAQLDNLEACLEPLLENLSGHASQLPLVDRAKLYTLTNYALESLLFCKLSSWADLKPVLLTEAQRD